MQVVSRASQTLLTIFGKGHPRRGSPEESLKDSVAKRAGFADADALERAKRFVALPVEEQERFFAERENAAKGAVPDRDLANPQRRAQNVAEQAEDAPDKESNSQPVGFRWAGGRESRGGTIPSAALSECRWRDDVPDMQSTLAVQTRRRQRIL